ncbi:hypothetical protein K7711_29020 [Nocardia sp. CA2R105]|uniref:hypothetical protein n=1 Tax=Nocardia coffeae TaxID=2873381 RepID=UPI001CA60BD4|nr:hypothetical protein [Nocardia coffeae]MBY8860544.1 hypothetical protein [Nocardia coffeae]
MVVDATGIFFVVETPDGNWGKDIDGLFLENLLPWQRNVAAAEYVATIVMIPGGINPSGVFWSAGMGIADNYVAQLVCGRCRARWWDGIRYGDFTAVRCPSCRGLNQVDSRTWVMSRYVSPPEDDIPALATIKVSPLTAEEIAEPRQVGQRLVGLIESGLGTAGESTRAQMNLSLDQDYLDTSLASGQPLTGWMGACAEIRAIGHQLHGVGGTVLMQRVLDTVTHEHLPIESVVDYYWRRIGGWRN